MPCRRADPSQFLELDKTHLKGLLLRGGGTTSHTVILARSFNIPTLVGVDLAALLPWVDTQVQIDGNAGLLVVDPSPAVARYYQQEAWLQAQIRQQQQVWLDKAGQTQDGIRGNRRQYRPFGGSGGGIQPWRAVGRVVPY